MILTVEEEEIYIETAHDQHHRRHPPHDGHGLAGLRRGVELVHNRHSTTTTTTADPIFSDFFCGCDRVVSEYS